MKNPFCCLISEFRARHANAFYNGNLNTDVATLPTIPVITAVSNIGDVLEGTVSKKSYCYFITEGAHTSTIITAVVINTKTTVL